MGRSAGTTEAHSRVRINSMIELAGFKLTDYDSDDPSVDYERAVRNQIMNDRLRQAGGIPDYHFYPPNSATPIAFLEAKRIGGQKLAYALKQATEYAMIAYGNNKPPMLVFASDGIQVKSQHADGSELSLNNYPVDYIPTFDLMQKLVRSPSATQGKAVDNVASLKRIFADVADLMRADGIDAGINQLREFCILLFIKIMSERGKQGARANWDKLTSESGENLMNSYQQILKEYKDKYGYMLSTSELNKPEILEQMVSRVSPINFTESGMDIKGQAFEYFLSNYSAGNKSALGQYFTPRHITAMMAMLLSPKSGDKIFDPFCGTGGMLISCYTQIRMGLDRKGANFESKLHELEKKTLYGNDISGGASSLAKMNMILLGDGQSNIRRADSFDSQDRKEYDKVITNIPFNLDAPINYQKLAPLIEASGIGKPDWNELCIVKCIESLRLGGSAAMILPLTICDSDKYRQVRNYVARKCRIRACIRLPEKTFVFYTTAQAVILVIDNAHEMETDEFTFIHLKSDGMSQDKSREPIPDNDIPTLLEYAAEGRLHEFPKAVNMKYEREGKFVEFMQMFESPENVWKLGELLTVKDAATPLEPNIYYAEPGLSSHNNTVRVRGNQRLGKNIKSNKKVAAEPGDLIIGTLHTNNGNGLFAIADRHYICTSQIVAKIKDDIVPPQYLIQALRREFPRQLIPTDLVGRENFTSKQILNVLIPKPSPIDLERLHEKQHEIVKLQSNLEDIKQSIETLLDSYFSNR